MSEIEYRLCRNCCLTFGGYKAGSLFACCDSRRDHTLRCLNEFVKKGIGCKEIVCGQRKLLYVYDRLSLADMLFDKEVKAFLEALGYEYSTVEKAIEQLKARFEIGRSFPHEVGVFLGYALEDVKGFMQDPAGGKLIKGYWKVYVDAEEKGRIFDRYRKYCENACEKLKSGQPLLSIF
ncbi:MAG: DUF3793 family protein [Acutalibacteraceae bacterium]